MAGVPEVRDYRFCFLNKGVADEYLDGDVHGDRDAVGARAQWEVVNAECGVVQCSPAGAGKLVARPR